MQVAGYHKKINPGEFQLNGVNHLGIKELLAEKNIDWSQVKENFRDNPGQFEELLFRVHYKRNKTLSAAERSNVLNFLSAGYLSTDDIRYFNEVLWFSKETEPDRVLMDACMERFNQNLDAKGHHLLPAQLKPYPVDISNYDLRKGEIKENIPMRICLIGFPPFFGRIIKKLKKDGHHVEQFFLPYHPNRKINRLLKFRLPVKLWSWLSGNTHAYKTLHFDHGDERIGLVLKEGNFDIGFHKLNFIIRENIFGAFRLGLLNDHWGYLPLFRGKSTIAYSVLLNIPVIPTLHFINKGIDSGPIAGYFPCDYSKAVTVKGIRNILRKNMPERAVAAIKSAGCSLIPKENTTEAGATFYEIHPWLDKHIASRILKH